MTFIKHFAATAAALLLTTSTFAQSAQPIPNNVKYRDSSIPNATGRSGGASIEARALLNQDQTVDLEVTTGSFDGGAAQGSIEKLQIKAGGETTNFNALDGSTVSVSLDGLARHDSISIQASVSGTRTGIVTATAIVSLRPDLSVVSVVPPPHALVGFPAAIVATITEHNGDTGARANCVLLADGVEVDRAEGVWVDAGDSVSCRFAYTFETAGVKNLQVVVDNVNPGDWDDSNNTASAELRVYEPGQFQRWNANATERDYFDFSYLKTPWAETNRNEAGYEQVLTFAGTIPTPISLDNMVLTTHVETDGQTMYDEQPLEFHNYTGNPFIRCRIAIHGPVSADVCQSRPGSPWGDDNTTVDLRYASINVTYHSWGRNTMLAPSDPGLVYNYVTHTNTNPTRFGNTIEWDVTVSDGAGAWNAQPFISSFTNSQTSATAPLTCRYSRVYGGEVCSQFSRGASVRSGSDSE